MGGEIFNIVIGIDQHADGEFAFERHYVPEYSGDNGTFGGDFILSGIDFDQGGVSGAAGEIGDVRFKVHLFKNIPENIKFSVVAGKYRIYPAPSQFRQQR